MKKSLFLVNSDNLHKKIDEQDRLLIVGYAKKKLYITSEYWLSDDCLTVLFVCKVIFCFSVFTVFSKTIIPL